MSDTLQTGDGSSPATVALVKMFVVVHPTPGVRERCAVRQQHYPGEPANVTAIETEASRNEQKPGVLFVNTRSALGADVAVHLTLIENLKQESVRVFVATNRHSADLDATLGWLKRAPHARLTVCDLGQEMTGHGAMAKVRGLLRNVPALFTLLRLARLVRRERIAVLHTTDRPRDAAFTTLLARMTGATVVLHLHLKWTPEIGRAARWAAQHAGAMIGISRFTCRSMIEGGIAPEKIFQAYNATDFNWHNPSAIRRGTVRERLGLADGVPVVGIVGRFTPWKGHLDLLTAFAKVRHAVPDARLLLVGRVTAEDASSPGGYVSSVRRLVSELGLTDSVIWVEWMDDVRGVMKDLDVMAMPSAEEPFGLVATECMSMERPVVGYTSGSLPELITDGVEGLLVPAGDTDALAQALVSLLQDPERRAAMGTRGRQRVIRDFSPRRQADEVTTLYRALARGGTVPGSDRVSTLAVTT